MKYDMIELVKTTLPEIDLKLSNQIIECITDITNITPEERKTLMFIMDTYYCSYEAIENLRKYIKKSYYIEIGGEKFDRSLLLLAENLIKGKGDGRISELDMKKLFESACDGGRITKIEKNTLYHIFYNFNCTDKAKKYLDLNISD